MVGLGIGLGLGTISTNVAASSAPENAVQAAIKDRNHLTAMLGGAKVLLQPYALLTVDGAKVVLAVVVLAEGRADGQWIPDTIALTDLSNVKVYNETFIPSDAFDPSALAGVVAVVEFVDPFKDAREGGGS